MTIQSKNSNDKTCHNHAKLINLTKNKIHREDIEYTDYCDGCFKGHCINCEMGKGISSDQYMSE